MIKIYNNRPFLLRMVEKIVVWEFLLFSGGLRFDMSDQRGAMLLILLTSFYVFYKNRASKSSVFIHNFKIALPLMIWAFLCNVVFNQFKDFTYIPYIFYCLSCCLAISTFDFEIFRNRILKYLKILCVGAIIAQLGHDYLDISATRFYPSWSMGSWGMNLWMFNTEWDVHRMACIYWEPGQFQVVLIFVLSLFFDELKSMSNIYVKLKKFGLLIISILMTLSTTGYITLGLLIVAATLCSPIAKKHRILLPFIIFLSLIPAYFLWNSSVVKDKFAEKDNSSYSSRMYDIMGMLRLIELKPITGFGSTSQTAQIINNQTDNRNSSNGWLHIASVNGIPYLLALIIFMYYSVKRQVYDTISTFSIMVVLIMSQAGEPLPYYPYMWMYIFIFKSYGVLPIRPKLSEEGVVSIN
jgi:O-Antigen ligase.